MRELKYIITLCCALFIAACTDVNTCNVRDFGAVADGETLDSPAINAAICAAAEKGGGTVLLPEGVYLCHSIRLFSHVNLKLEKGAVLKAASHKLKGGYDAPEPNEYDAYQDFGHSHWRNSLIYGIGLEDVSISGEGIIDGSLLSDGFTFRNESTHIDCDFTLEEGTANKAIALKECRNVSISGITILRGGHFCLLATGVDSLCIDRITVDTGRDGLDMDCCSNVVVRGCRVNSPRDDGIVLKASYALGYYKASENIVVEDCFISGYKTGSFYDGTRQKFIPGEYGPTRSAGRIKLGTESTCDFRNVAVRNCTLEYCGGLHVESADGANISNVSFDGITIKECSDSPIFVMIGARLRAPEGRTVGSISDISFRNISSYDACADYGVIVSGYGSHRISNIKFENVTLHSLGGHSAENGISVPEIDWQYPDPKSFGCMPSSGMFLRHVDGVQVSGVLFQFASPDGRPVTIEEDCNNIVKH